MIVSVIGLGYIGLPTAAILASRGVTVIGIDVSKNVVDNVNQGLIHIVEPGLDILVLEAVKSGNLKAFTEPVKADVFVITVPTPFKGDNEPDLSFINSAIKSIAPMLEKGNKIILESTSPVGTTEKMVGWLKDLRTDLIFPKFNLNTHKADISVAYCPERVLPGNVVRELVENDRVIGGISDQCAKDAKELYKTFVEADCLITDCRTAELSKLIENSFRDVNIAFANELSLICDKLAINVWDLIKLANRHPRVNILQPGPGVGGHCIAVDPWFIVDSVPNESKLIKTARLVNDRKPDFVLEKVFSAVQAIGKKKFELSIACLGLSFKSDIDDLRESPALEIAKKIGSTGFNATYIVEPNINQIPSGFDGINIHLINLEDAIKKSDIVVLLVDHYSFKLMDLGLLSGKQLIDTRGIWS